MLTDFDVVIVLTQTPTVFTSSEVVLDCNTDDGYYVRWYKMVSQFTQPWIGILFRSIQASSNADYLFTIKRQETLLPVTVGHEAALLLQLYHCDCKQAVA